MFSQFHMTVRGAETVVATTALIYLVFIVLVRITGQRSLSSMSSFDFAGVVAFGAVLGRTALLENFNLMSAVLALLTLFAMQSLLGFLRRNVVIDRLVNPPPIVLVADGRMLRRNMRHVHVVESEIRQAVRRAGLPGLEGVQLVVMERNGSLSLVARGHTVDPWLLSDVAGHPVDDLADRPR